MIGAPEDPTPTPLARLATALDAVLSSMRIGRCDYGAGDAYNAEAEKQIRREVAALLAAQAAAVGVSTDAVRALHAQVVQGNQMAVDARDAKRYRALRRGLVAYVGEDGELGLGCTVLRSDEDGTEEPITEAVAPFLTPDERADLNGSKPGAKGVLRGDAVDRIVDWLVSELDSGR
jgi:hypothetical protein